MDLIKIQKKIKKIELLLEEMKQKKEKTIKKRNKIKTNDYNKLHIK